MCKQPLTPGCLKQHNIPSLTLCHLPGLCSSHKLLKWKTRYFSPNDRSQPVNTISPTYGKNHLVSEWVDNQVKTRLIMVLIEAIIWRSITWGSLWGHHCLVSDITNRNWVLRQCLSLCLWSFSGQFGAA